MSRRIVFVAPFGLGEKTTIWARTLPLAQHLAHSGDSVFILVPPWDTPASAGMLCMCEGVRIENMSLRGGMMAIWARLTARVKELAPDIVHVVKPIAYSGLVQWWLWQERRLRCNPLHIVLDIDDWEQAWAPINGYSWPVRRFLAWQEEWGIRHADGITAASHWLVQRAQRASPPTPVIYLPNGISTQSLPEPVVSASEHGQDRRILFFSRYVEVSPSWFAEFCAQLRLRLPAVRISVAGKAIQAGREAQFQRTFAALADDAASAVDWLGYVQKTELYRLYESVGCAIFPAENVPLHQAKCSVRLATTLLHGVPVVASAVGEQASYGAAGSAHLVDPDTSPAQFADEVVQVLNDPARRRQLGARAQKRLLAEYDWDRLGERLSRFYKQIDEKPAQTR